MLRLGQHFGRRQAIALLSGAIGGAALHACTTPNNTATHTAANKAATLGIVVWTGNAPLYIAQEKGFFRDRQLTLTLKTFSTNPDGSAAFATGRLDGWAAVTSEAVVLANRGKNFRVVMVQDVSQGADGILARNSVTDLQAFKGKRVAVEEGGVSHFFLLQALQQVGLSDRDFTLVNMLPDAVAAAYQVGKVEIAVTYSPFLEQANAAQKDGRMIYDSSKLPLAISDLYLFDTQFLQTQPETIQAFVDGCFQGLRYLEQNSRDGVAIAAKNLGVVPGDLEANLQGLRLPNQVANVAMLSDPNQDTYLLKSLQAMAQFLKDQGQISQIPDLEAFIEPKFVLAAQ